LHLATHAEFLPGKPSNSYIQFGDRKLKLSEVRELGLNNPEVELIVLSACQTAVGDRDAEYGFASLAYQAGVKSAIGSLWSISDAGTLALMSNFYKELKDAPIKAEALRLAQVAMIKNQVQIKNDKLIGADFQFDLPVEIRKNEGEPQLAHPYYWSAFSLVGNPW
jgi:CHAT domain-containing protein